MNKEKKYSNFALCREMLETPAILGNFKLAGVEAMISAIKNKGKVFFTGEGSSRIFPAKNAMYKSMRQGTPLNFATDGGRQASEYDLSDYVVFAASNSGSTKEIISLLNDLKASNHPAIFGLTARDDTKLSSMADASFVLSCGWEEAVAATKSVEEQALFYQELLAQVSGKTLAAQLKTAQDATEKALTLQIDPAMIDAIANAGTIYFAGKNDGVAEELTLKTNEITRKKSDFLEGTYAVHGIEEVMNAEDVVICIDPFDEELEKFKEVLVDGVGMKVFAVSTKETIFPTIVVPEAGELSNYVYLCAGWNILVEVGLQLNIDLDKPERARKVGNEFMG
jgi:glucosamine--fructose-6-phosphate aminotransferase (isomerizing)